MIKKLENRKWKVLKSTPLLNCGPWLNIRQELVELPSGAQIPTWFVMHFHSGNLISHKYLLKS